MSEPDWSSTELRHRLSVEMVDALRHSDMLGSLDVNENNALVTNDITVNTISQASITCYDWSQWIENSWIRVVDEIPEYNYRNVLGTYFVYSEGRSWEYGSTAASPALYSSLKALSLDKIANPIFIGEGAPISRVFAAILDPFVDYSFAASCGEYYYTSPYVIDAGITKLDALKNTLSHVNWEYRLNGDSSLTFMPFVPYEARAITYTIDANAGDSFIYENTLKPEGTNRISPGRSIVVWKGDNSDDEPVTAYADVPSSNPASPLRRGYIVSELHEVSDMNGDRTAENALIYARQFLERDAIVSRKWSMETLWFPMEVGDCVNFRPPDEKNYVRTIVQSVDYDLSKWKLKLTLVET